MTDNITKRLQAYFAALSDEDLLKFHAMICGCREQMTPSQEPARPLDDKVTEVLRQYIESLTDEEYIEFMAELIAASVPAEKIEESLAHEQMEAENRHRQDSGNDDGRALA